MKKTGIVGRIMATVKLGEEGKIGSFFNRLQRDFEREISAIQHNKSALDFEYNRESTQLEEKIEDALQAVEDAWLNVSPEQVATNALQDGFKGKYIQEINSAENKLNDYQEQAERLAENYKERVKMLDEQIQKYEARIDKLNS